jgi:hypothetical protein
VRRPTIALIAAVVIGPVVALGCGEVGATSSSPAAVHWAPTWLPAGYHLLRAERLGPREHRVSYGPADASPHDATLEVVTVTGRPRVEYGTRWRSGDRRVRVRGRPGLLRTWTDEGRPYATQLVWRERRGLTLSILTSSEPRLSLRRLLGIAAGLRPAGPARWRRLVVQTSPPPDVGQLPGRLRRVPVAAGRAAGAEWRLAALIPRDYPLGPEDRRVPCAEVTYRGQRSYGHRCGDTSSWARVEGTTFAFGAVDPRVRRVRLRLLHAETLAVVPAHAAPGLPTRFYVAPLPPGTCAVEVDDPDGATMGTAGPIPGDPGARECAARAGASPPPPRGGYRATLSTPPARSAGSPAVGGRSRRRSGAAGGSGAAG